MRNISREELMNIVRDELEQVRSEMTREFEGCFRDEAGSDTGIADCLKALDDMERDTDRLRPELPMYGDPENDDLGDRLVKAMSATDTDDELVEDAATSSSTRANTSKKKKKSKRSGKYAQCKGRGQRNHDSQGRFSTKSDATSHSLYFSCPEYPFRTRKGMKALTDPKDSGRGAEKEKGKGRYRMKDNKPLWEGVKNPTMGQLKESFQHWLSEDEQPQQDEPETVRKTDRGRDVKDSNLKQAIKTELTQMLGVYEKWLGDQQTAAFQNTHSLDDTKLSVFSNSYGHTTFRDWVKKTGALDRMIDRVMSAVEKPFYAATTTDKPSYETKPNGG